MIRTALRLGVSVVILGILSYFFFFVPLGERTLYEHVSRISQTDEAQEFGREVGEASERLGEKVADTVEDAIEDRPPDAGAQGQ